MTRGRMKIGRLAIAVLLVGGALTYLVVQATSENLTYYYEVDELQAAAAREDGRIRISGDVVEGSVTEIDDGRSMRFEIESSTPTGGVSSARVPIVYDGTVPDIFRPGIQVVVEGTIDDEGTFHAETLLTKCPSKYQAEGELTTLSAPPLS